jgi:hypothetical protein
MPTTTNYGWTTPADTDLVKDGAAAIRTLGSSIDTTLKTQIDAQIPDSLLTTTGDVIYASGANTPARLGIGTNGQVLQVSGGLPAWGTAPTGGMTLISTTTLSGATTTLSSIPQTYNLLYLVIKNVQNSGVTTLRYYVNGVTTTNYSSSSSYSASNQTWSTGYLSLINAAFPNSANVNFAALTIDDYTNTTTWKKFVSWCLTPNNGTPTNFNYDRIEGFHNLTSAISSITFYPTAGTHTGGTVLLYGVK